MAQNKLGLSRHIPEATKKLVRKACGFGCVICGSVPYDYDHLATEFNAAEAHNPDDIVLLCDKHHRQKTAGILSVDRILAARRKRDFLDSETRFKLELIRNDFLTIWGSTVITANDNSIIVDESPILNFTKTDNDLEPLLISGEFHDKFGNVICTIENNEFVSRSANLGDFTVISNRFRYLMPDGTVGLAFSLDDQKIHISSAFHAKSDAHVFVNGDLLQVGNLFRALRLRRGHLLHNQTAISVGTCCDHFSFIGVDISRIAGNEMVEFGASGNGVGVRVAGNRRLNLTSNYSRLGNW